MEWKHENYKDQFLKWGLFLVSPILGLFYSFMNLKTRSSFVVIYAVGLLFGLCLTVEAAFGNADVTWYADSMRHRAEFEAMANQGFGEYQRDLVTYFTGKGEKDIYAMTMYFLVSRFTSNYHIFFLCIAAIYGFFSIQSLRLLVSEKKFDNSLLCLILVYVFLSAQILEINGVRFYTGAWVAIFSLLQIFINKKRSYFLLLAITPLIHSGFFLFIAVVVTFYVVKRWPKLCYVSFFISFALSELFAQVLTANISILPDFIANSTEYYLETENASRGFFFDLFSFASRLFSNLIIVVLILTLRRQDMNENTKDMFLFTIFLAACSNFFMSVPIFGTRMKTIVYPFFAYIWLKYFYKTKRGNIMYLYPIVNFYFIFFLMPRTYIRLLEPSFFYSSPIYLITKYFWI